MKRDDSRKTKPAAVSSARWEAVRPWLRLLPQRPSSPPATLRPMIPVLKNEKRGTAKRTTSKLSTAPTATRR